MVFWSAAGSFASAGGTGEGNHSDSAIGMESGEPVQLRLLPMRNNPRMVTLEEVDQRRGRPGIMNTIGNSPGYAFLASALFPGLGQAANNQWWKTAFLVAVEATAIGVYIHRENRGRDGERYYQTYGDANWSVVQYAQYIAEYHGHQHGFDFYDMLTEAGQQIYNANGSVDPAFNTAADWPVIDREALREAERNSQHSNGVTFSHTIQDYGSQQYYELMSKYFQFGPGWRMWDGTQHHVDNGNMPEDFLYHARIGFDFNDDLSVARNMLTVIIANHFLAAFDAYFTQKLREARIQPTTSMQYGLRPTIGFAYRF
jgi:hypothetical protein